MTNTENKEPCGCVEVGTGKYPKYCPTHLAESVSKTKEPWRTELRDTLTEQVKEAYRLVCLMNPHNEAMFVGTVLPNLHIKLHGLLSEQIRLAEQRGRDMAYDIAEDVFSEVDDFWELMEKFEKKLQARSLT